MEKFYSVFYRVIAYLVIIACILLFIAKAFGQLKHITYEELMKAMLPGFLYTCTYFMALIIDKKLKRSSENTLRECKKGQSNVT